MANVPAPNQLTNVIRKINEKNPYIIIITGFVIVLVVDYFLLLQFQLANVRSLNPKITLLSQDLEAAQANIAKLDIFQAEIDQLTMKNQEIKGNIKSKEETPLILENISRLANKNEVLIDQVVPNAAGEEVVMKNNDGQYLFVPVKVEASCGYHNFGRFLNQLENEEKSLTISDFSIAGNNQDTTHHTVNLNIKALIFEGTP